MHEDTIAKCIEQDQMIQAMSIHSETSRETIRELYDICWELSDPIATGSVGMWNTDPDDISVL